MAIDPGRLADLLASVRQVYGDAEVGLARSLARRVDEGIVNGNEADAQEALRALRRDAAAAQRQLDVDGPAAVHQAVRRAGYVGRDDADDEVAALRRPHRYAERAVNTAALDSLATAAVSQTREAHSSILRVVQDAYRQVQLRAASALVSGHEARRLASQRTVWALLDRGLGSFVDKAGRRWRLTSYAEMTARTNGMRALIQGHMDRLDEAGLDLVIVSDHSEECPRCRPWEGQVLTRRGSPGQQTAQRLHAIDDRLVSVNVAGTVDEARRAGLFHPNCRHNLSAYLPGLTEAPTHTEDERGGAARVRQREMEREVRKYKVREAGALSPAARAQAKAKRQQWEDALESHVREYGLKRLRYRESPGAGSAPTRGLMERDGQPFVDQP